MTEKFIVWDQIALHGASPEEAFKVVKEHYPEICDEELNRLIQQEVEKEKEREEEYENFLIENNMTREEHEHKMAEEAEKEHRETIKDYFMLSDEDVESNNIDVSSLEEFFDIVWTLGFTSKQLELFSRRDGDEEFVNQAVEQWQRKLEETIDKIYLLSKSVDHETMRHIFEAIHIMESKTNEKRAKRKYNRDKQSVKTESVKQVYASLEDSFAKRNDIFRKGKRLPGSAFSRC